MMRRRLLDVLARVCDVFGKLRYGMLDVFVGVKRTGWKLVDLSLFGSSWGMVENTFKVLQPLDTLDQYMAETSLENVVDGLAVSPIGPLLQTTAKMTGTILDFED